MDEQVKEQIKQAVGQGMAEEDIAAMAESGVPNDEIEYALSLLNGGQEGQSQEDQAQEGFSPEDKETVERFVVNAMTVASGEHYDKMVAMAKSAKGNKAEGVGRAIFFVMSAVKKGLEGKGVQINPELWLEANGLLEQTSKIVAVLLDTAGLEITPEDVQQGMGLAAESLGMESEQGQQAEGEQEQMPQQSVPQQQNSPQQSVPPSVPPQGLMQQGMQQQRMQ